jgi:hypothetical protein
LDISVLYRYISATNIKDRLVFLFWEDNSVMLADWGEIMFVFTFIAIFFMVVGVLM